MRISATGWNAFCFQISGGDPKSLQVHPDIAQEERRVARAYTFILLGLLVLNFTCTAMSAFEVFIDIQPSLTMPGYLAVVVLPVSFSWTLIVFCILRFMIQIGHDENDDWWTRFRRLITMLPAWCLMPLIGLMASAPLQVRALGDDIRLNSVMVHWKRLSNDLIDIQLSQARVALLNHHDCVSPLMRPEVIMDTTDSLIKLTECQTLVIEDKVEKNSQEYSLLLLDAIHRELRKDGLISRVGLAFDSAPGTTWLIALIMMILFSAPILTRILARKRAYEYLQYDSGRRELMKTAGIELHAHDAFDHEGNPVSLHRYRHVEVEQSIIQKYYESKRFETNEKLKRQTEAVSRLI
jgi:hypothetical protein